MSLLVLERPLVFLDLETTGPVVGIDRVVQVATLTMRPDGSTDQWWTMCNPGMPIPAEASVVHGITDAVVQSPGVPSWHDVALSLATLLDGSDVAGYGVERFDWPLLLSEWKRAKVAPPRRTPIILDAMAIYHQMEKRDLTAAVRFYLDRKMEGAHDARADAEAAAQVLAAQVGRYQLPSTVEALAKQFARPERPFGGKLVQRGAETYIAFGASTGTALSAVDSGWLRWFTNNDFPADAKHLVRAELERRRQKSQPAAPKEQHL